jgi:hypothetical protein
MKYNTNPRLALVIPRDSFVYRGTGSVARGILNWAMRNDYSVDVISDQPYRPNDMFKPYIGRFKWIYGSEHSIDEIHRDLDTYNRVINTEMVTRIKNSLVKAIEHVNDRHLKLEDYPFYYSTNTDNQMDQRLLIPFYHKQKIIGYTARWLGEKNYRIAKYFTDVPPGYVFNCDVQNYNRQFVLVMEGPLDAIALDGVAVLGSEPNQRQEGSSCPSDP